MYYVYTLKSLKNQSVIYTGYTNNLKRRFSEHNRGLSEFTKRYRPWELLTYTAVQTKRQALALEAYFKSGTGRAVLKGRILGR